MAQLRRTRTVWHSYVGKGPGSITRTRTLLHSSIGQGQYAIAVLDGTVKQNYVEQGLYSTAR